MGKSYHIKVSDHAMYCSKYEADYYISDTKAKLPIRWMAWESLLLVSGRIYLSHVVSDSHNFVFIQFGHRRTPGSGYFSICGESPPTEMLLDLLRVTLSNLIAFGGGFLIEFYWVQDVGTTMKYLLSAFMVVSSRTAGESLEIITCLRGNNGTDSSFKLYRFLRVYVSGSVTQKSSGSANCLSANSDWGGTKK